MLGWHVESDFSWHVVRPEDPGIYEHAVISYTQKASKWDTMMVRDGQ